MKKKVKQVADRAKQLAEHKLLEQQIELARLQAEQIKESWWKKNILPLAALLVSVFQLMGFGGAARKIDPAPPPAIVFIDHSATTARDDSKKKDKTPTEPFDPSLYNPLASKYRPTFYSSPINIPEPSRKIEPRLFPLLQKIHSAIEKSENPKQVKARIIQELEASRSKRLVNDSTVNALVTETRRVEIINPSTSDRPPQP